MAKRPSVQEILEAARRGGPATPQPAAEPEPAAAPIEEAAAEAAPAPPPASPAVAAGPTPSSLGRPLTVKEKLAAARAGGTAPPAAAAAPAPGAAAKVAAGDAPAVEPPAPAVPPPAKPLGRPLTLAEKLAAARGGAAAPAAGAAPAKPAAAKPAAPAAGEPRAIPPLDKITDPKDLAEALRQAGARKDKEAAAAAAAAAPPKPAAKASAAKPSSVLPKPSKAAATTAGAEGVDHSSRRGFFLGPLFVSWIALAWTSFAAGCVAFTGMLGRFMFPNVLAEPPSTIKVGEPGKFDPEDVNERFKAEWGFWIVRSTRYDGQDIIYALSTICTHLGCPPNWLAGEQKFKCPCHGSGFYVTGINFEGPAPRPLERYKVTLADDGQIVVDKSQKFQQELGQWSDPDSFISV
ncbi:Cytochrome b6-f complex iron-sulfur subunit [Aquisphaera giovannonii]|uniref:Cytochrome b6-f complex iron-sulfur subunit n=1 Tax=Aquisphaera giovannonii TaxID=406548 RepID=A0A5B9W9W2_9BACT|nr:ubiquinol-cytochrome c reductase iron-sulfur subunit [Aquisphaera giovannonii]QEH36871.1 Cytochrome b6-f complex iron-sulfur subunit [Aquisphaera giovannonii]